MGFPLAQPKSTIVYMPVQGSWASSYTERLGFRGHSLPGPFYIRDMVGIHYIYAFRGKGTFLDTPKSQIQHCWGMNSCAKEPWTPISPKKLCSVLFRSLNAIVMYTAGAALLDARASQRPMPQCSYYIRLFLLGNLDVLELVLADNVQGVGI